MCAISMSMSRENYGKKNQSNRSKYGSWVSEVKQSDTNPLQQALAQGRYGGPHPDADILTALSEGALLQAERQRVLAHITVCTECREVLSVAAGAALDLADDLKPLAVTRNLIPPQRIWLPWASIAAGLMAVCLALLIYHERAALPRHTEATNKDTAQLPAPPVQSTLPAVERKKTPANAANASKEQAQAAVELQSAIAGNVIANDKVELAKKSDLTRQDSYKRRAEVSEMEASSAPVLKAAPVLPPAAFANTLTQRAMSAASVTAAARPHWRINNAGQAERAYGDGAWQAVLPLEQSKMRVVSVFDREVWIGGENVRLYHSTDNGATWKPLALPEKNGREHSIVHIHFQTSQAGTVESDDGIEWTTSDGGSTWK